MDGVLIRPGRAQDAAAMGDLLNDIIRIGGTTAIEAPLSVTEVAACFLTGTEVICCFVAQDAAGAVIGFQGLERHPKLPANCADIASFTRRQPYVPGIGSLLFPATCDFARAAGFAHLNATIRADNASGLGYYARMGFRPHSVVQAVPLRDGTPVDRVSMRFDLG